MNEETVVDAELLPAAISSARTLALIAKETPEVIMARAVKAAKVLKDVITKKDKPVKFNGEIYLEFEDWQTVANFYNASAKVISTTFVNFDGAKGFECHADLVDKLTGQVLSSADAMCLNDEEKWSTRTKYEWCYVKKSGGTSLEDPGKAEIIWEEGRPKKERVKMGEVAVPLFQLRSMAQTRACSKVIRNVFAWVVVLAGYKPTPAEEMDGVIQDKPPAGAAPAAGVQRASASEPTKEELAALEEKRKAKAAQYAKDNPPATDTKEKPAGKEHTPVNGIKTATSFVTKINEPNKGGYVTVELDNFMQEDGRFAMRFATKDTGFIETITAKQSAGEKVSIEYKSVPWSKGGKSGMNYEITDIVSVQ